MNLRIELKPESVELLRSLAEQDGVEIEAFVKSVLERRLREEARRTTRDESAFVQRLDKWIALHPNVTHFVDDSRDTIYEGRGE